MGLRSRSGICVFRGDGMIVACYPIFNEDDFIAYSLRSVYPFVDRIIILDGAGELMMFCANPDGSSTDNTLEIVRSFPDPEHKIGLISRKWASLLEKRNTYLRMCDEGDIVFTIDGDEVYKSSDVKRMLHAFENEDVQGVLNLYYYFYPDFNHILTGRYGDKRNVRIFRLLKEYRYIMEAENVVDGDGEDIVCKNILSYAFNDRFPHTYHYSRLRNHEREINRRIYRWNRDLARFGKPTEAPETIRGKLENEELTYTEFQGTHPSVMRGHPLCRGGERFGDV